MKRLLTKLLVCAAAFGGAFAVARTGRTAPAAEHSATLSAARKAPLNLTPDTAAQQEKALRAVNALLGENADVRAGHLKALTPKQLREHLDTLFATLRMDEEAGTLGMQLLCAWLEQEPFEVFAWCQAHHFEFARPLGSSILVVGPLFRRMDADDPARAAACWAQLPTMDLRKGALTGLAVYPGPRDEAPSILKRLLAFGAPGEEVALKWLKDLSQISRDLPGRAALLTAISTNKQSGVKWRAEARKILTVELQ